ncbi:MAG: hypothetical protein QOH13_850, partial [Thermoleophilaceae bacterium]|nr:hypothetical protein [Thermoleophilaceae bacterium]
FDDLVPSSPKKEPAPKPKPKPKPPPDSQNPPELIG